jgi:extracellular factor (EF) 3-hydroxypalmitic acid methyl ester biosynthesis protein
MQVDPFQLLTASDRALVFGGARRASYQRGTVLFREGEVQPDLYVVRKGRVRVDRAVHADPFQHLTQDDRKLLFDKARRASYERGDVLFHEGATQPDLYVVRRGLVRVTRIHQSQRIAVARYGPDQVLGELSFLEQRPAFGTATAEEHVEADIVEGRYILAMLASDSSLASRFYRSLALCLGARLRQILPGLQLGQGQNMAVASYGPGEVLGEIAFLAQQPAFGTVVAEEDVDVDILDGKQLQAMLLADGGFASRFYHSLALCLSTRLRQILPGLQLPESLLKGAVRPPRTGQLTRRQLPPELTKAVENFRGAMGAVGADLHERRLSPTSAQQRVHETCNVVIAALDRFTKDGALLDIGMADLLSFRDLPDVARGIGGYVFRETFAFFMQSAAIAYGFEKPRGYPEDREFLERIERNEAEGDGPLGPFIDAWFLDRPLCRARRTSLRRLTSLLSDAVAAAPPPGPVHLTSLTAGTAREIFDFAATPSANFLVTCIDNDADTLLIDAARASDLHCADRITFMQADLNDVERIQGSISLGPQHAIYGLGVCDYMSDAQIRSLVEWAHGWLVPGGWLLLTNRDAASPDRAFTEHILDWPVIHRTPEEFTRLLAGSRFEAASLEVETDDDGVNLFARCRRR